MTEPRSASDDADDSLVLDVETHTYTFRGQRVPSVTQIIQSLGLVDTRWFTQQGKDRGNAVHLAAQLLVLGRLDMASVDPRIGGYVDACARFLDDASVPVGSDRVLVEHLVHSRVLGYAGRTDIVTPIFKRDVPAILDWKSGYPLPVVGMQLAAYAEPVREELGIRESLPRAAVHLREDGTYKMTHLTDYTDFSLWRSACQLYNRFLRDRKES